MRFQLLILLFLTLGLSCNKKEDNTYYFTCKVNGVEWKTECKALFSKCFTARFNPDLTELAVVGSGKGSVSVALIDTLSKINSGTYVLNSKYVNGIYATGNYSVNIVSHRTDSMHTGMFNINIDEGNTIISGTFAFNTATGYNITDGKFRMPYTLDK